MESQNNAVIVGGGLVGPLAALAMADAGLSVTVVDAAPASKRKAPFDGRAYAFSYASIRMLEALGLWSDLEDEAGPILDIKVTQGRPGAGAMPAFLHFDHSELDEGPFGHMVEDRLLRAVLLKALAEHPSVTPLQGARVTSWEPGAVTTDARAKAHRRLEAPLIIASDGRNSAVAEMASIARQGWAYDQMSLVAAVEHEKSHDGVAHQFFAPAGPLAILPLSGNRSSIVWTERADKAKQIQASTPAEYLAALRPVFGSFLGEIELVGERYLFPLGLSLAEEIVAPRMVLAGDAAHGIHPLAGQGLNLGVRDAAALAEVVVEAHRRGEDIGAPDVLERYRRWRGFETALMAVTTDSINRLFSNDLGPMRTLRNLGMAALNRVPAAKRQIMAHAAGLTADRPRLLKGLPL